MSASQSKSPTFESKTSPSHARTVVKGVKRAKKRLPSAWTFD